MLLSLINLLDNTRHGGSLYPVRQKGTMMQLPVVNMRLTGERISQLREARGLTVRQLQRLLGFATPQAIYKWQHGETLPTIDNLVALSAILNVPIQEILVTDGE